MVSCSTECWLSASNFPQGLLNKAPPSSRCLCPAELPSGPTYGAWASIHGEPLIPWLVSLLPQNFLFAHVQACFRCRKADRQKDPTIPREKTLDEKLEDQARRDGVKYFRPADEEKEYEKRQKQKQQQDMAALQAFSGFRHGDTLNADSSGPSEALGAKARFEQRRKQLALGLPPSRDPSSRLDLAPYSTAKDLEALGLERLKEELTALGLKCGGTLPDRAARLFLTKGLTDLSSLPAKLFAKQSKAASGTQQNSASAFVGKRKAEQGPQERTERPRVPGQKRLKTKVRTGPPKARKQPARDNLGPLL